MILKDKKAIVIGERDGIPSPAIEACLRAAGADVVLTVNQCFVWTAAGAMSLEDQGTIKNLVDDTGSENLIVILGTPDPRAAELYAETLILGDPTYAGPLAGVALNLPVFFVTEPDIKEQIPAPVYQEHVGLMEMVLPVDDIVARVKAVRERLGLN